MNNTAWTWTVFQLMTQAGMQEEDNKDAQEAKSFLANLLHNNAVDFPKMYK
jgi:hypothetical protein